MDIAMHILIQMTIVEGSEVRDFEPDKDDFDHAMYSVYACSGVERDWKADCANIYIAEILAGSMSKALGAEVIYVTWAPETKKVWDGTGSGLDDL